ncbi:MAG: recombination mediator RecR [Candidatus Zixiibacteriota bacterium]
MFKSAASVEKLANQLARLPGIGRKSAARLTFHILKMPKEQAFEIAEAIKEVKEKVGFCSVCYNISETDPCKVCTDHQRDKKIICVVEDSADAAAIDKAEGFNGMFHVLGGCLSPLDGVGPEDLKIRELIGRLKEDVKEVIIATNPSVEGEATAVFISRLIKPIGIRVTRIARGLPVGSDLEYADSATLTRALDGRQEF